MSYVVNGIKYDYNSSKNQKIKEKFVGREVCCLVNSMVEYILSKSWDDSDAPFSYDDVTNYYTPKCSKCGSSYSFDEGDSDGGEKIYICSDCEAVFTEEEYEYLDTKPQEIFQWFMVTDFLADKLKEKGECVIEGEDIWGRGCFGQAILLDHVISEICEEMEILEGQRCEWSVN